MKNYTPTKKTIVKINGIPFYLDKGILKTNNENHKLVFNQLEHSVSKPIQAPTPPD